MDHLAMIANYDLNRESVTSKCVLHFSGILTVEGR